MNHGFPLFKASGYVTAYYGKYLNRYSGDHVPAGWSRWAGLVRNSRYYNYTLNIDGKLEHHGDRYETDYLPDLITNKTLALIREMEYSSSPFMAVLGEFVWSVCDYLFNIFTKYSKATLLLTDPRTARPSTRSCS